MRDRPREPRTYELLTILSPDVPEDEIPGQIDRIAGYVGDAGGTVQLTIRESPWGRRRLSYPIRHAGRDVRDGFYTLFRLDLVPNRVDDLERELKLNTQIIRYLVTHFSPKTIDQRAVEEAEIAAEQAAAEAYTAAQAEAARAAAATESAARAAAATEAAARAAAEVEAATAVIEPADEPAETVAAIETVTVQAEVEPAVPAAEAIPDEAPEPTIDATEPAESAPAESEAEPEADSAQEATVAEAATEEPASDELAAPAADEGSTETAASQPAASEPDNNGERSSTTEEE